MPPKRPDLTKRQRIKKYYELFLHLFGRYNSYSRFDATQVTRLVFVCAGNICRSAVAEFYVKSLGAEAASFGVNCPDGDPANSTMMRVAATKNLHLEPHLTTSMNKFTPQKGDLFVAMEKSHIDKIKTTMHPHPNNDMILLGLFADERRPTIIDPYGKPDDYFDKTTSIIFAAIDNLRKHIAQQKT